MLFWNDFPGLKWRLPITYLISHCSWLIGQRRRNYLVNLDPARHSASLGILLLHLVEPALIATLFNSLGIVE